LQQTFCLVHHVIVIQLGGAMKIFMFFAILILGFFVTITAAVRPDIVEQKYKEMRAPFDQHFADKRAMTWKDAKESARAIWMLKLRQPADCRSPKTAIREMECNNTKQQFARAFEQDWADRVRNGWKPEGVEE
jgi:hypothetical protein